MRMHGPHEVSRYLAGRQNAPVEDRSAAQRRDTRHRQGGGKLLHMSYV